MNVAGGLALAALAYAALAAAGITAAASARIGAQGRTVAAGVAAWNLAAAALAVGGTLGLTPACLLSLAGSLLAWAAFLRHRLDWRGLRQARELRRQALLHFVLLTGSAAFVLPFLWMLVTSVKEDEDMSRFPPVWVPRQQVRVRVDGRDVGLATALYEGRRVRVAVLEELETGQRVLRVLDPPSLRGREFRAHRSQVVKIKQFAPVWKNYPDALKFLPEETHFGLVFLTNTLLLAALTVLGTVLSGSLVAYSFARLRWPGRDLLFLVLLSTMMLPGAVTMMPRFLIFRWLGWIDTLRPLWAPAFLASAGNSAFSIFLLRQFFLTIPTELEEAARIDGCSYFGIYWRIMLPLIKPALAAITIMTFMASWNDFMGPLIYVSSPTRMPLSYALGLFQTAHSAEPGLLMAAAVMMVLPVLVLFFFTQRWFIQGVTLTGLKG